MLGVWDLKGTHRYKHSLNPCAVCKQEGSFRECKCCNAGEIFISTGDRKIEYQGMPSRSLIYSKTSEWNSRFLIDSRTKHSGRAICRGLLC